MGTRNFFFVPRSRQDEKKTSFSISLASSKPYHLSYSTRYPVGVFQIT